MRNDLILALDRTGCLQTARWSNVNPMARPRALEDACKASTLGQLKTGLRSRQGRETYPELQPARDRYFTESDRKG